MGNWDYKKIGYNGYHELAYLHPLCFSPDFSKVPVVAKGAPYFIVRFSSLSAYHDKGKQGLDSLLVIKIIEKLSKKGRVFISSETTLHGELEKYRLHIDPLAIHDVMAFAELYLGDSQTMTAEAAVLGVPALRFNDFVGRISYLEELEHKFGLTFGYKTDEADAFLANLDFMLAHPRLKEEWVKRRSRMLAETIDVNVFFKNLISDFKRGEDKNELAS
jgi:predicted glycosyltransferase